MKNDRKVTLTLGKNEPKQMPRAERRRRAKMRTLESVIVNQTMRIDFMKEAIQASTDPIRKRYLGEYMDQAIRKRKEAKAALDRLRYMAVN